MTSSSPFTTSSAFLESCSTSDILTYTVATSATIDESAPRPVLAQPDDHALSSSTFFPSQQNTTGFILSRVVEDAFALELRWVAFSRSRGDEIETEEGQPGSSSNAFADLDKHPGTLPPVRFVFPARLVPGAVAAFALAPDGKHLEVYAVTEARYLYVLTFPLETLFYGADLAGEDAPEWSDEFKLESLEGRTPVLMKGIEDGRVVVACADGFVACMDFATDGTLVETELKSLSSFSIRSLVPSFSTRNLASPTKNAFPSSSIAAASSPSQLISLTSVSYPSSDSSDSTVAFGLCRDRKLKIWNLGSGYAHPPVDLSKLVTSQSTSLALTSSNFADSPQSSRLGANGALLSPTPQTFLKPVLGSSSTTHPSYLALFIPPSPTSAAAFVVCGLEVDASTGELSTVNPVAERVCPAGNGSLVDFGVQRMDLAGEARWTLWSVWDEGGEAEIRTISVLELDASAEGGDDDAWVAVERGTAAKTAQWTASYFDEQLRDSQVSVPDTFLRHVSLPGRYPAATLDFALAEYEELVRSELENAGLDDDLEAFALDYPTPLQRAAAIVGVTVVLEQSPQTGAFLTDDFNKRLKLEWLRFVALLNESRTAALFPTHLAIDEERGVVAVVGRDSVSVPVVREAAHTLSSLSLSDLQQQQRHLLLHPETSITSLVELPSSISDPSSTLRADVLPLLFAIRTVEARLPRASSSLLEAALLKRLGTPLTEDIEDVALSLFESVLEPLLSDDVLAETLNTLSSLENVERAVEIFANLLTTQQTSPESAGGDEQASTDLTAALLTDFLATSIASRYALAKGLVTLLLVVWAAEDDGVVEADVMGTSAASAGDHLFSRLDQATSKAFTTLHALAALQWVAVEITTPDVEVLAELQQQEPAEDADAIVSAFGDLKVGSAKDKAGAAVSPVPTFGLLNALLRLPGYSPSLPTSSRFSLPVSLSHSLASLSSSLGLLPPSLCSESEITASPAATTLAYRLLVQLRLPVHAGQFVELWPRTAAVEYVRGRAALELTEGDVARIALERVASGLFNADLDDSSDPSSTALSLILPPSIGTSLANFYSHVVTLFVNAPETFDIGLARFAELALEALEDEGRTGEDEGKEKDLWIKLFRSYAALGEYEKAYEVIMSSPYHDTQMTCLAHFISVVCENGATALLTQYSFAGLEADLERNLAFRARNSDPLARPNYYKVLYAYHISKGDYRSAGTVMYQQGRRLGEMTARGGSFRELATLQCQSYLAATSALSLVKKEHAWVAIVSGDESERGNKRRKIVYQIPEEEFDPAVASRPLEVLELADIRKEYTVALARLQLAGEFPELKRTNFHLDHEAVVALFSQTGAFEPAFAAGRTLGVDLSSLFETVAERCVALSLHPEGSQDATWVTQSDEAAAWDGSLSSKAWRLLENHLDRHDIGPAYPYRLVVLERTLATNRGGKVPAFLTDYLAKHNLHSLVRTLIKYDRLDDAFPHSLSALKNSTAPPTPFSTTLPYSLFDQLLAIPAGDSAHLSDDVLKQKQAELREAVKERTEKVDKAERTLRRA